MELTLSYDDYGPLCRSAILLLHLWARKVGFL